MLLLFFKVYSTARKYCRLTMFLFGLLCQTASTVVLHATTIKQFSLLFYNYNVLYQSEEPVQPYFCSVLYTENKFYLHVDV